MLCTLPAGEADDVHLLVGEAAPGRGETEEVTGVPSAVGAVHHGGVALGQNLVDVPALLGKGAGKQVHVVGDAAQPGRCSIGSLVADEVLADHLGQRGLVISREDLFQNDQMGRPAINTVFNHGTDKNTFNVTQPSHQRALFGNSFENTLKSFGYDDAHADAITDILLPDILTYNYSSSEGFLNGRKLTDDVIDIELTLVTDGKITTDMVGPHTDYLNEFPYVGQPHV